MSFVETSVSHKIASRSRAVGVEESVRSELTIAGNKSKFGGLKLWNGRGGQGFGKRQGSAVQIQGTEGRLWWGCHWRVKLSVGPPTLSSNETSPFTSEQLEAHNTHETASESLATISSMR